MRIAQVMLSGGWGGAERLFVELCRDLGLGGHETLAVCRPEFSRGTVLKGQSNLQYETIPALCNWDYLSVWKLERTLREFKPDLIHAHLARASWMTSIVGRRLQIPTVSTTHNRIKAKYVRSIDYFTTITRELTEHLENMGKESSRIEKIPNFSSIKALDDITRERHAPLVFVALGRFVHKKGFDVLLEAFREFLQATDTPARLVLAGEGPLDAELTARAHRLGIEQHIDFPGWVEDTASLLDSGDIFVLPSRDEPFGIVLLEAMARGKAIIATKVGGPRDFLSEETCFFVQPDDSHQLCLAMQRAVQHPELCASKASAALELFRAGYTGPSVLPRFVSFYERIKNDRRPRLSESPSGTGIQNRYLTPI